ncbi:DinB family protein [Actinoplanes sp. NPDC051411]|uniref:DinB family protein n=1 Tax=Actinoplanes sp. NPDC051411 TaxID=3155522 RepID=UPI00343086CA
MADKLGRIPDEKTDLLGYLRNAREAVLWKLDGLSDYDVRRPLTPTGTNLLGLVKHLAYVDAGYFGATFGRPFPETVLPEDEGAGFNADMYASADETREQIEDLYRRVGAHSDATIEALPLDAPGDVPWWGDAGKTTLHSVLVHMLAETARHAGHADILRESIDGVAGLRAANSNLPEADPAQWSSYRDRLEEIARTATASA